MYICRRLCLHLCNSRLLCIYNNTYYKRDVRDCHLRFFFLQISIPPTPLNINNILTGRCPFPFPKCRWFTQKRRRALGNDIREKKNNNKYKHHLKSQTTIIAFHICVEGLQMECVRGGGGGPFIHIIVYYVPHPHTHSRRKRRRHTGFRVCNVIQ